MTIREILPEECAAFGELLVEVYSRLEGFPGVAEQPDYYRMLANVGALAKKHETKILVALSSEGELLGGVVYFGDMAEYGSGGIATGIKNASGIRLLGVGPRARGRGVGKKLTQACIDQARRKGHKQVILHTTRSMQVAWQMYERMGFKRSEDLDFVQGKLPVFGFRLDV